MSYIPSKLPNSTLSLDDEISDLMAYIYANNSHGANDLDAGPTNGIPINNTYYDPNTFSQETDINYINPGPLNNIAAASFPNVSPTHVPPVVDYQTSMNSFAPRYMYNAYSHGPPPIASVPNQHLNTATSMQALSHKYTTPQTNNHFPSMYHNHSAHNTPYSTAASASGATSYTHMPAFVPGTDPGSRFQKQTTYIPDRTQSNVNAQNAIHNSVLPSNYSQHPWKRTRPEIAVRSTRPSSFPPQHISAPQSNISHIPSNEASLANSKANPGPAAKANRGPWVDHPKSMAHAVNGENSFVVGPMSASRISTISFPSCIASTTMADTSRSVQNLGSYEVVSSVRHDKEVEPPVKTRRRSRKQKGQYHIVQYGKDAWKGPPWQFPSGRPVVHCRMPLGYHAVGPNSLDYTLCAVTCNSSHELFVHLVQVHGVRLSKTKRDEKCMWVTEQGKTPCGQPLKCGGVMRHVMESHVGCVRPRARVVKLEA